jgi:hypothetical protein
MQEGSTSDFDREPVRDGEKLFVRSTCPVCGLSFTGSVMNGLCDWEREHHCQAVQTGDD